MVEISTDGCIGLLQASFPKFLPYWEQYINNWGDDLGLILHMMPFTDYVVDVNPTG